jgi:diadenylate cyclase
MQDWFSADGAIAIFWAQIWGMIRTFSWNDALDILLVTFLLYQLIKLLRDTRAVQLVKGIALIAVVYAGTVLFKMNASSFLFSRVWDSAIVVVFLIFQPEIRHAVESMGRTRTGLTRLFSRGGALEEKHKAARRVAISSAKAAASMSEQKIGALMVFERRTLLGDVAQTGTILEANISSQLLGNVFYPKAPLHDGAAIIRGGILYAAGCVLPLTQNPDLPASYGMRHRAALGISEQSDAVVLIVSEETGNISLAMGGVLTTGLTEGSVREELTAALDWEGTEAAEGRNAAATRWKKFWDN